MALMEWFAGQPYSNDLNESASELSQMTDPGKRKDVSEGVPYLKDCLQHKKPAWPKEGYRLSGMRESGGGRLC
jgi:hypothetical protein